MQYLFKNVKSHSVKLPNKNGRLVHFAAGEKKILGEYFRKYVPKHLSIMKIVNKNVNLRLESSRKIKPTKIIKVNDIKKQVKVTRKVVNSTISISGRKRMAVSIVGRASQTNRRNATEFSQSRIKENSISISNDIGVGILSYNRLKSLIPLIESIRKYTDLNKTTIFVSDESSDPEVWNW